jgi:hypothetical protein
VALTDVAVCNRALVRIGQKQAVTSLDPNVDTSSQAQMCQLLYGPVRDGLLCIQPWGFATRQALLVAPTTPFAFSVIPGWAYQYVLPTDYLQGQYIFSGARPGQPVSMLPDPNLLGVTQVSLLPALAGAAPSVPYEVLGGYLFCDLANAQLVYTTNAATDPTNWPPLFADAVAWQLAVDLALSIATKAPLAQVMQKQALRALELAIGAEGNARQSSPRPDSSFIAIRG